MHLPERSGGRELAFAEAGVAREGVGDASRVLTNAELDFVSGGLNALMIPAAVVAAVMAALDMDEYWIPYFNQKMDEAGR